MIRTCVDNECKLMRAGDAKALNFDSIKAVFPTTGDAALTKALTPPVGIVMESMKGLDEQKSVSISYFDGTPFIGFHISKWAQVLNSELMLSLFILLVQMTHLE